MELTAATEESLANLPSDSLEDMLSSLQVHNLFYLFKDEIRTTLKSNRSVLFQIILINLKQQEKDINALESKVQDNPNVADLKDLLIQLRRRIESLIARTTNGIALITVSIRSINHKTINFFLWKQLYFHGISFSRTQIKSKHSVKLKSKATNYFCWKLRHG